MGSRIDLIVTPRTRRSGDIEIPMSRRRFVQAVSAMGATWLATSCGAAPSTAGASASASASAAAAPASAATATPRVITKVTAASGGAASIGWSVAYVALQAGYFLDEGLDLDYTYANVQVVVAAIVSGSIFLGFSGAQVVLSAIAKGAPVRIVTVGQGEYTTQFAGTQAFLAKRGISDSSPIAEKVKALRGAKIAINTPGDSADNLVRFLLKQYASDINPDRDLTMVPVRDPAGQLAAIANGSVDVIIITSPYPQQAEKQGLAKIFIDPQTVPQMKGYPFLVVSANQSDLQNRLPLVTGAVRAIARGAQLLRKDPEKAKAMVRKHLPDTAQDVFDISYTAMLPTVPAMPVLTKEQFAVLANFNEASGTPIGVTYDQAVDTRAADQAVKDLKL